MKPSTAIKQWLEKDSVVGKVSVKELMEFKKVCDPKDFVQMAQDSANELGVELDA